MTTLIHVLALVIVLTTPWCDAQAQAVLASLALGSSSPAVAQSSAHLDAVLEGLTSADLKIREDTFYALIMPARRIANTTSSAVAMRYLLRTHPDEAEQLKSDMISALELANRYRQDLKKTNAHFDEYFSDYYSDLIWVVASLRDPRALSGLLFVIDTGGMAVNGLADLGPIAVDAVIQRVLSAGGGDRQGAVQVLGAFLTRLEAVRSNPEAAAKARRAVLAALDDPDIWARRAAIGSLLGLKDDPEVKAALERVAASDPYSAQGRDNQAKFLLRDEAERVLSVKPEGLYYVMRTPATRECRVQQSTETPVGARFMGPFESLQTATVGMCTHYDDNGDPSLCRSVQPKGACRE